MMYYQCFDGEIMKFEMEAWTLFGLGVLFGWMAAIFVIIVWEWYQGDR